MVPCASVSPSPAKTRVLADRHYRGGTDKPVTKDATLRFDRAPTPWLPCEFLQGLWPGGIHFLVMWSTAGDFLCKSVLGPAQGCCHHQKLVARIRVARRGYQQEPQAAVYGRPLPGRPQGQLAPPGTKARNLPALCQELRPSRGKADPLLAQSPAMKSGFHTEPTDKDIDASTQEKDVLSAITKTVAAG